MRPTSCLTPREWCQGCVRSGENHLMKHTKEARRKERTNFCQQTQQGGRPYVHLSLSTHFGFSSWPPRRPFCLFKRMLMQLFFFFVRVAVFVFTSIEESEVEKIFKKHTHTPTLRAGGTPRTPERLIIVSDGGRMSENLKSKLRKKRTRNRYRN